jgi:hypothetical protein
VHLGAGKYLRWLRRVSWWSHASRDVHDAH